MHRLIILLSLLLFAQAAPAAGGPRFGSAGGIGSTSSGYSGGEPSGGTFAINGATGVATFSGGVNMTAAPSSPENGRCWTNTVGLFCRINGTTVGPMGGFASNHSIQLYVDNVNGSDGALCGLSAGPGACATIQRAYGNACTNFTYLGGYTPTINLTAGQTYGAGLHVENSDAVSPACVGVSQVNIDGHGATISTTNDAAIYLRYVHLLVRMKNTTLRNGGSSGYLVFARGGGTFVQFGGGMNFGATVGAYPQLAALQGAQIATCPLNTCPDGGGYTISGGGGFFAQALLGGSIQLEGVSINIASGIAYSVAFANADTAGTVNFSAVTWTGSNVTGDQFKASKLGVVNTNAQTGSFTSCVNSYLPGSLCGQQGYVGGRFDNPGTPTATGCGGGCLVQQQEPAFNLVLGTGLDTTIGATVGPVKVNLPTRSNYSGCSITPNDPAFGTPWQQWTGPTDTMNGFLEIWWKGTGVSVAGKTIWIFCQSGP